MEAVYQEVREQDKRRLRWPELSWRIQAFRGTSDRDKRRISNISSKVVEYKYMKYIY